MAKAAEYTSQPPTSAVFAGRAARHVAQGRVSYDATPTPARCAMPILPQRWLGFRQAEGAPRRRISLHGSDTSAKGAPFTIEGTSERVASRPRRGLGLCCFGLNAPARSRRRLGEMAVEYLTTHQVAERLHVRMRMVVRLLASG